MPSAILSAATRPVPTRLIGRDVLLVPLDPATHGDDLWAALAGPTHDSLWAFLPDGPYTDRDEFLQGLQQKAATEDRIYFAILTSAAERAVGYASLMRIDVPNAVIEVGNILYTPALQRTRGGTEAMFLLAKHVFDDLGYRRYEWKCHARNARSRQAALRLGFSFEGVFRQHMIVKGLNRDTAWFSLLDTEWPTRKRAFEAWLVPENFDASGRQKHRLMARVAP